MIQSLRNIATFSCMVGMLMLSVATAYGLVTYCDGGACLTASVSFGVEVDGALPVGNETVTAKSTPTEAVAHPSVIATAFVLLKSVGTYLIFFGVGVLLVLEVLELRYLRQLISRKEKQT